MTEAASVTGTEPVPGRPHRPGTVGLAAACYWLAALLILAQLAQVVYDLTTIGDLIRRAGASTGASHTDVANEIGSAHTFDVLGLLVTVGLAGTLLAATVGFSRGSHRARVASLVAAGLTLLCCTGALAGSLLGSRAVDSTEFQRQVTALAQQETPDWVSWLTLTALAVYPILILGVVMLLLPASNRYYRPYAGYFAYPIEIHH